MTMKVRKKPLWLQRDVWVALLVDGVFWLVVAMLAVWAFTPARGELWEPVHRVNDQPHLYTYWVLKEVDGLKGVYFWQQRFKFTERRPYEPIRLQTNR